MSTHAFVRPVSAVLTSLALSAAIAGQAADPTPRVVAAWAAGPLETRVAFDRPLDPKAAIAVVGKPIALDGRERSTARSPRAAAASDDPSAGTLHVASARLIDDGRTLVLATDPHSREGVYSLSVPVARGEAASIVYDLSGVAAVWERGAEGAAQVYSGWWPDLNVQATRRITKGSFEHERAMALLDEPGRLTVQTLVTLPAGKVTFRFESNRPIAAAALGGENGTPGKSPGGVSHVEFAVESTGDAVDLSVSIRTGPGAQPLEMRAAYRSTESAKFENLARERQAVPWAPATPPPPGPGPPLPELAGGDRGRGEAIFYGEAARCANCHIVRGKGKNVGPDLTRLSGRDRAGVYRDIAEPSSTIRPDYVPYTVALKDGRVVVGIVRAEGTDSVRVTDTDAKATVIAKSEIEELRPSATSIMPVGLAGAIGEAQLRDLLAFLTGREGR